MTERPILFSGPMVRAILEGRKTVTRRQIKPTKDHADGVALLDHGKGWWPYNAFGDFTSDNEGMEYPIACPYGVPGDRLWVRESLHYDPEHGHFFAAGGRHGETVYLCSLFDDKESQTGYSYDGLLPERSVPSIHLHRRYSRILLEITAVRVERLQDISEDQAEAEGTQGCVPYCQSPYDSDGAPACDCMNLTYKESFQALWSSINGAGSWAANPWIWAVEFKRVTP